MCCVLMTVGSLCEHGSIVWGEREMYARFLWGNVKERGHYEYLGVDGRIILKWISRKWDGREWSAFI